MAWCATACKVIHRCEAVTASRPLSGHIFGFANAGRNRLKLLFWDGSGLWVCSKRLERGRFRWPGADSEASKIKLTHEELVLLLGGIDLAQTRRRRWYRAETQTEEKSA
jgi:transposase